MIFKTSDLVHYKLKKKYDVYLKPLDVDEKEELGVHMFKATQGQFESAMRAANIAISICLKDLKGLDDDGEDYKLEFDDNGRLSKESLSVILNSEVANDLNNLCGQLLNGVPTEFKDSEGKVIKDIKFMGKNTHLGKK